MSWKTLAEKVRPLCCAAGGAMDDGRRIKRVELLESATLKRWYNTPKTKYGWETDSEQVPQGKDEKHSEKRVQRT